MGSPDEVEEIFDAISYCKGASIIRMLHEWIGDKVRMIKLLLLSLVQFTVMSCVVCIKFVKHVDTGQCSTN